MDSDYGLVNKILAAFGAEPKLWYNSPSYWPGILIFAAIWKGAGSDAVLYYASLMGVDKSLFEAADIDGAGKMKRIISITIPELVSLISIMIIMML